MHRVRRCGFRHNDRRRSRQLRCVCSRWSLATIGRSCTAAATYCTGRRASRLAPLFAQSRRGLRPWRRTRLALPSIVLRTIAARRHDERALSSCLLPGRARRALLGTSTYSAVWRAQRACTARTATTGPARPAIAVTTSYLGPLGPRNEVDGERVVRALSRCTAAQARFARGTEERPAGPPREEGRRQGPLVVPPRRRRVCCQRSWQYSPAARTASEVRAGAPTPVDARR